MLSRFKGCLRLGFGATSTLLRRLGKSTARLRSLPVHLAVPLSGLGHASKGKLVVSNPHPMLLQAMTSAVLSSAACRKYSYQEAGKDPQQAANASASTGLLPGQTTMDLVDAESATVLAFKYMLDSGELLQGPEARGILIDFAGLVAAAHPVGRSGCLCCPHPA